MIGFDGRPVTTLMGTLDQAALQGLLRRLYSLGILLISVNSINAGETQEGCYYLGFLFPLRSKGAAQTRI